MIKAGYRYKEKEGGPEFIIETLGRFEAEKLVAKALELTKDFQAKKAGTPDKDVLSRVILLRCVVGWTGLTNFWLAEILDAGRRGPGKDEWQFVGKEPYKKDTEMPFNEANLELLAEFASPAFHEHFQVAQEHLRQLETENARADLKN